MTEHTLVRTMYVKDGLYRRYETKSVTPHHEFLRSQYPAETSIGSVDVSSPIGFGMFFIDERITNDAMIEWRASERRKAIERRKARSMR